MSEYVPSPREFVSEQVRLYEGSGGTEGLEINDVPCVIVTHRGRRTGSTRKTPLIRVQDGERYLLVASMGGAPTNPRWVHNLVADPEVTVQDGPDVRKMRARLVEAGEERDALWAVATAAFPPYAEYQGRTERLIPVFVAEPA